ncbi:hypothetical protein A2866_01715 [Candidatus Roizmanbacteria bacterium RIFCSPHIGHO2_01_FULL_39_8]|uniref:Cupin type-2 domain-containing protein n=3 Tax=Candidatus Roizmaniibacteriota TaxID=1752723 RepID=A0A1F7GKH1_9BACT|nr:MAG: hypothetical protein A2866_01715 [Candidatus Roizmanbacteria bacterium RIFCSPHIGHO2_01_FULL_39_8]OGK25689.1 MAG: hypothetical protein A3C28_01485 [Candidatus Roizmanbacteria bacterium RIFCSPHIGHO2_02_FULL_39_9]OGK36768.1 MAG: hypothetical protein A3F60_04905 [Candidatus Roizmanbacteria bacterium RIFCSPHIGHO2_12_FULL_39_8]
MPAEVIKTPLHPKRAEVMLRELRGVSTGMEELSIALITLGPGYKFPFEKHPIATEIWLAHQGAGEVASMKDGDLIKEPVRAGDVVRVDPTTIHRLGAEDNSGLVVTAFSFPAWRKEGNQEVTLNESMYAPRKEQHCVLPVHAVHDAGEPIIVDQNGFQWKLGIKRIRRSGVITMNAREERLYYIVVTGNGRVMFDLTFESEVSPGNLIMPEVGQRVEFTTNSGLILAQLSLKEE